MFGFLSDLGTYQTRKVGRDEFPWGFISTCRVSDGDKSYETAVSHDQYRKDGNMVIVEAYDTREEAEAGHSRWVSTMTTEPLPETLSDCLNAGVAQFSTAMGNDYTYKRGEPR